GGRVLQHERLPSCVARGLDAHADRGEAVRRRLDGGCGLRGQRHVLRARVQDAREGAGGHGGEGEEGRGQGGAAHGDRAGDGSQERAPRVHAGDRTLQGLPRRVGGRDGWLDGRRQREAELREPLLEVERHAAERPRVASSPAGDQQGRDGGRDRRGKREPSGLQRQRDQQVGRRGEDEDPHAGGGRAEDRRGGDSAQQHPTRAADASERVHASLPAPDGRARRATRHWSTSAASANASAAAKSQGATAERLTSGCGSALPAACAVAGSPAREASRALSSVPGCTGPPQRAVSTAASRAKRGWSTRSPRAGTPTITVRMQPAPCGTSIAAGSPSTQRATTRPAALPPASSYAAHRSNGATTTASPAARPPTESGAARAVHGGGTAGAGAPSARVCVAGQWTSARSPFAAHAESTPSGVPRTTSTLLDAVSAADRGFTRAKRSGSSGSPSNATTAGAAES